MRSPDLKVTGLIFGVPHIRVAWIVVCCFAAAIAFVAFCVGIFVLKVRWRLRLR
jgi:hypothetical protein